MAMAQKTKLKFKIPNAQLLKKLIFIVLLGIIIFNVGSEVINARDKYFSFNFWQNFQPLKKVYLDSQYVNKHPKGWIPDEIVNAYAGGEYILGSNPVLIAADTPPLGRYLIGLSAFIFNNANIVTIIFALGSLLMMYLVSQQIFSNKYLSIIPPLIFSFEPIFKNQIKYSPLLDIFQLFFLLVCFYFFNRSLSTKKILLNLIIANVFLGFFMATKFYITGMTIAGAWFLIFLIKKKWKETMLLILCFPISIIVMLSSYIMLFVFGYSIKSFLGVQKYIFVYHKTQLILPFSIWPLILFNKWYVWYGNKPVISETQWLITWPIITIVSIFTLILGIIKKLKINENLWVVIVWMGLYFGFFSFGQITARYFVILIPALYIISTYFSFCLFKKLFIKTK
jgi:hypothetical protein